MLLSLQIKNNKSILDLTLPMTYARKKAPNGYKQMELLPFLEEGDVRTIPCLALYGANASGKSNIIIAYTSPVRIIKDRYYPKAILPDKLHPHDDITSFALEFLKDGRKFLYSLEVDGKEIIGEQQDDLFHYKQKHVVHNTGNRSLSIQQAAHHIFGRMPRSTGTIQNSFPLCSREELCGP
jgi:AAA15 family ATPase/GTPase